jgi:hypothetical protein
MVMAYAGPPPLWFLLVVFLVYRAVPALAVISLLGLLLVKFTCLRKQLIAICLISIFLVLVLFPILDTFAEKLIVLKL